MSNIEINRQIVQEGLEKKKAANRQRMNEAAHEAEERKLRVKINQHAQERQVEIEAAEAEERLNEELRIQKEADRAQEENEVGKTIRFTYRIFGILLYAVLVTFCYIHENISAGVALTTIGLAVIYCIAAFVKYASRSVREQRAA